MYRLEDAMTKVLARRFGKNSYLVDRDIVRIHVLATNMFNRIRFAKVSKFVIRRLLFSLAKQWKELNMILTSENNKMFSQQKEYYDKNKRVQKEAEAVKEDVRQNER